MFLEKYWLLRNLFSVALITATIIISQQLKYIRGKDLGYNKENVFKVPLKEELQNHYDAVRAELFKTARYFRNCNIRQQYCRIIQQYREIHIGR